MIRVPESGSFFFTHPPGSRGKKAPDQIRTQHWFSPCVAGQFPGDLFFNKFVEIYKLFPCKTAYYVKGKKFPKFCLKNLLFMV
jgi:hypothetical protein